MSQRVVNILPEPKHVPGRESGRDVQEVVGERQASHSCIPAVEICSLNIMNHAFEF